MIAASDMILENGDDASEASGSHEELEKKWTAVQDSLRRRLNVKDDFTWQLPMTTPMRGGREEDLKYVGGVDVSYSRDTPSVACAGLVVLDIFTFEVVYEDYAISNLLVPYVPGFLAFREAPTLLKLLKKMKDSGHPNYPQLLMVDGNGLLHPRGFGLACHLGVLANLPTVGIGKNLHHVDGLTRLGVTQLLEASGSLGENIVTLTGVTGQPLGMAFRLKERSVKPIFISVGHRILLASAVAIVKMMCKHRVPEPIRQADIRSKNYLLKHLQLH